MQSNRFAKGVLELNENNNKNNKNQIKKEETNANKIIIKITDEQQKLIDEIYTFKTLVSNKVDGLQNAILGAFLYFLFCFCNACVMFLRGLSNF